jgi:hypothetical protein
MYTEAIESTMQTRARVGFLVLLGAAGCQNKGTDSAPPAVTSLASAKPVVAASASASAKKPTNAPLPTVRAELWPQKGIKGAIHVDTIDGAVMVASGLKVGHLSHEGVTWLGTAPGRASSMGQGEVMKIVGAHPGRVGAFVEGLIGRIPEPGYHPIQAKGGGYIFGLGGGIGFMRGLAYSHGVTLLAGYDMQKGPRLVKVAGPLKKPVVTPGKTFGCKEDVTFDYSKPAVDVGAFGSTRKGTIVSVGEHCKTKQPMAEVWLKPEGKGKLQTLPAWKRGDFVRELLQGPGDTLYAVPATMGRPLLRFAAGKWSALARLKYGHRAVFVSPEGDLFASDGASIFHLVDSKWKPVAKLDWPNNRLRLAKLKDTFVASYAGKLYRLNKVKSLGIAPDKVADCKTPLIYLSEVKATLSKRFGFPKTSGRLGSFEELAQVKLVEFEHKGQRRLGIVADSPKVLVRAYDHAKKSMVDDNVRLLCFRPEKVRVIPVKAKVPQKKEPSGADRSPSKGASSSRRPAERAGS